MIRVFRWFGCVAVATLFAVATLAAATEVRLARTPNGGIQPQVAVGGDGTLHLVYFRGEAGAGDVFYVRRRPGAAEFSAPLRVNAQPGSVLAVGSIRGAQMALGKGGRVHVAWMGSNRAARAQVGGESHSPMLYTRLSDQGTAFEPERNVLTWAAGLDGGGSVAADGQGTVWVVWHGSPPNNQEEEAGRAVFVARSQDDGKTFSPERQANSDATGACACCGLRAFADLEGRLWVLYRAAKDRLDRGMNLLASSTTADGFSGRALDHWRLSTCPMSSMSFAQSAGRVLAAWETADQIQFCAITPGPPSDPVIWAPPDKGNRKHPSVACNAKGEMLVAWTENTGWEKGGAVAWQLFGPTGAPLGPMGRQDGVPVWGLVAAAARPDGGFVVFY